MDAELSMLLEKSRGIKVDESQLESHRISIAVANGVISDSRVTIDAMKATMTVVAASKQSKEDGR